MAIENLIIYTQRPGATSPKELRNALDCRRIAHSRLGGVREIPPGTVVVNWGAGRWPDWAQRDDIRFINNPVAVRNKVSKVAQIRRFQEAGVPTLAITTDRRSVEEWLRVGARVLGRQDGSFGGRGIRVYERGREDLGEHDFYSKYFPKTHEYRAHVFQGGVIDLVQKKRRQKEAGDRTLHQRVIRSWSNGWIFAHNDLHLPGDTRDRLNDAAVGAVRALDLDFGAVDILVDFGHRHGTRVNNLAVCEVNTAPGLENTKTIQAYVNAIRAVYEAGV